MSSPLTCELSRQEIQPTERVQPMGAGDRWSVAYKLTLHCTEGGMAALTGFLEWVFALYFLTHIPITLLVDLQALVPGSGLHPQSLTELLKWYAAAFKDPMMLEPPAWFNSFIYCEAFLQLPFFPIAAYAFLKGGCKWIRTPAIIYSTHVATTLFPILAHILFHDFSASKHRGPETQQERLTLLSIYAPYLLIPLLILFTMLYSPQYNQVEKRKRK